MYVSIIYHDYFRLSTCRKNRHSTEIHRGKKAYLQSSLGNSGERWKEKEERLELLIHTVRKRKREGGSETT
jgi:hypothetical protein